MNLGQVEYVIQRLDDGIWKDTLFSSSDRAAADKIFDEMRTSHRRLVERACVETPVRTIYPGHFPPRDY